MKVPVDDLAIHEALAVHEAFRRLGFSASEIYLQIGPTHDLPGTGETHTHVRVVLKAQDKTFHVDLPLPCLGTANEVQAAWRQIVAWWNDPATPKRERLDLYENRRFSAPDLILNLLAAGFRINNKARN